MIRRLFFPLATAVGFALCAIAAAPAVAKDKPAAEGAAGDAKADKKKSGKAEAEKPSDAKKAEFKAAGSPKSAGSSGGASKPSDAKKADAKKPAESKKTTEAKKGEVRKPEAEDGEGAAAKDAKKGKPGKDAKEKPGEKDKGAAAKAPVAVSSFGDWNAMTAHGGKDKTCYALAEPKERQPAKLQRDKAYVFISTRPGEGVRNEVAIIMGFPLKDGGAATAEIDGSSFELVTKGANAWVKNPAKEKEFVDALRNGSKLVVKAPSIKGNVTTDLYSLKGLSEALTRVQKECQ
ncbi:MAG TPA: invasion associated locus B family protein [Methylosinus sp.]